MSSILLKGLHQLLDQLCTNLAVNELEFFHVVRDRVLEDWAHFFDSKFIDGVHTVDQCLKVFHHIGSFEDDSQLVARKTTIVK